MAEQKTAQQQAREQFKVAESTAQNMLRVWNDAFLATTEWTLDMFERSLRFLPERLFALSGLAAQAVELQVCLDPG